MDLETCNNPVKYCWVTGEIWKWNQPAPGGGFVQILSLQIELQDKKRNLVARENHDMILTRTDRMVTVEEMQQIRADEKVLSRIADEVSGLKKAFADY